MLIHLFLPSVVAKVSLFPLCAFVCLSTYLSDRVLLLQGFRANKTCMPGMPAWPVDCVVG